MSIHNKMRKAAFGLCTIAAFVTTPAALALGTAAGTNVQNTFVLTYDVGGTAQAAIDTSASGSNTPTEFTVDRKIDLSLTSNGNTVVAPGSDDQELVFALTNLGNDTQDYAFTLVNETGDEYNATGLDISYYFDDGVAGFGPGDLATPYSYASGSGVNSQSVAADDLVWVVVAGDIPAVLDDLDESDITLIADTLVDGADGAAGTPVVADTGGNTITGAAENVLADSDSDGAAANDGLNDGNYATTATFIVADADLEATKAVTVFSQDGAGCATIPGTSTGGLAIPGACVEYVISVKNNGTTAAANVTDLDLSDVLPSEITFQAADVTVFGAGTLSTPTLGDDCGAVTCTVAVTAGAVPFGQTATVIVRGLVK